MTPRTLADIGDDPQLGDTIERRDTTSYGHHMSWSETIVGFLGDDLLVTVHGGVTGFDAYGPTSEIPELRTHWRNRCRHPHLFHVIETPRWFGFTAFAPVYEAMLCVSYGDVREAMEGWKASTEGPRQTSFLEAA